MKSFGVIPLQKKTVMRIEEEKNHNFTVWRLIPFVSAISIDHKFIFCFPINFHAFPAHMPLIFVLYITMYFIHDTCRWCQNFAYQMHICCM
jgi:hypothetical protein